MGIEIRSLGGLVGPSRGAAWSPVQFGELTTWGIAARGTWRFETHMRSGGYPASLGISPQDRYPVRFGPEEDPGRQVGALARESG